MLEVSKKYNDKGCGDYPICRKCPFHFLNCHGVFEDLDSIKKFKDLEFNDDVPEQIKNYVKEVLLDDTRKV